MKLIELQFIFAKNVSKLIQYIADSGYSCTLGEVWRPPEMAKIYASQGKGVINSLHTERLAIDINIFSPEGKMLESAEDFNQFGQFWKRLNPMNKWGGDFVHRIDSDHFSMSYDERG